MHLKYIWGRKVENIHCRIGLGLIIAEVRGWVHGSSLLYSHYFCIHLKISTKQTNEGKQKQDRSHLGLEIQEERGMDLIGPPYCFTCDFLLW